MVKLVEIVKTLHEEENKDHIAIIGLDCSLGKFRGKKEVLELIAENKNAIRTIPKQRKKLAELFNMSQKSKVYTPLGYMDDVDSFDYSFFNIPGEEARLMDPRQRLFIQSAWKTIEDAGYSIHDLSKKTGIFLGLSNDGGNEYYELIRNFESKNQGLATSGNIQSMIASRISYLLDLHGPALVIDTACSSSMVALHTAIQSILSKDCDSAIVGGINIKIRPKFEISEDERIGNTSSDYLVRSFDNKASGTNSGEGCGSILIKKYEEAIKDNDHIYAVIRGSAINQDGKSNGITAPNGDAQIEVIKNAWGKAGVTAEDFSFIETHGTGTILGDPIEFEALSSVSSEYTEKKQFCALGSIKSNIGHTDSLAGIAGIIKAALCLENNLIPASYNFVEPNHLINFSDSSFYLNKKLIQNVDSPMICGVSSFGLSGTNAHVVLESIPEVQYRIANKVEKIPLLFSASSVSGLLEIINNFRLYLKESKTPLETIAKTLNLSRRQCKYRLGMLVESKEEAIKSIEKILQKGLDHVDEEKIIFKKLAFSNFLLNDYICNFHRKATIVDPSASPEKVMALFCEYEYVDLEKYYEGNTDPKVSIPGYSFEKNSLWITNPTIFSADSNSLIGRIIQEKKNEVIFENELSPSSSWILEEHKIKGFSVIPGTAYIDMLTQFIRQHYNPNCEITIKNVNFFTLFKLKKNQKKILKTIITDCSDHFEVAFFMVDGENNKQKTAEMSFSISDNIISKKEDLAKIKDRMKTQINFDLAKENEEYTSTQTDEMIIKTIVEEQVRKKEIQLGKHWKTSLEAYYNENEVFCKLGLKEENRSEFSNHFFHPSLMDCAVNSATFKLGKDFYLPYFYKNIKIYAPIPIEFYVLLKVKPCTEDKLGKFDISVIDLKGQVICEIIDYVVKKTNALNNSNELCYKTVWKRSKHHLSEETEPMSIVVIGDENNEIKEKLIISGHNLITSEELYNLSENSKTSNKKIIIVSDSLESFDSVEHFFAQMKELVKHMDNQTSVTLLTKNAYSKNQTSGEEINPFERVKQGLIKVIGKEANKNKIKLIDYDKVTDLMLVLKEAADVEDKEKFIRYIKNERYTQYISAIPNSNKPNILIKDSTILIAGGLGGIGTKLIQSLVKERNRIIAVGRTSKDKLVNKIKEFEKLAGKYGSSFDYYSLDISNEKQAEEVLAKVKQRYETIDIVFLSVGQKAGGFIKNTNISTFLHAVSSKVLGAKILLDHLKNHGLKMFISFSSINSLLGAPGEADYVAANSFLDAFSQWAATKYEQIKFQTLSWSAWKSIGLISEEQEVILDNNHGYRPLNSTEALSALNYALNLEEKHILIADLDINELERQAEKTGLHLDENLNNSWQPESYTIDEKDHFSINHYSREEIKQVVAQVWENIFKLELMDHSVKFFELGGDSILATYLFKELDKVFPEKIDISDIYIYPSIVEMSQYLNSLYQEKDDKMKVESTSSVDELDEILEALHHGKISVEEIKR